MSREQTEVDYYVQKFLVVPEIAQAISDRR